MTSTMPKEAEYIQGADLPDLDVVWYDSQGEAVDMQNEPHTFVVKVGSLETTAFTKSTGITGKPWGLTISWATVDELNTLAPDRYILEVTATRTSDNRQRRRQLSLKVNPALP